jgi:phospholipid transport system substrate-binding protein
MAAIQSYRGHPISLGNSARWATALNVALRLSRRCRFWGRTMKKNSRFCLTVFSLAILITHSAYAESQALKDLKTHIASVQQVLTDPKLADREHRNERRRLAVALLHQIFDFEEMSRRSLGANARRYSDRLQEFTPLFVNLLEQTYMDRLEENGDAKIEYIKEVVDGPFAEVQTKTKLKDGTEYSINYKLNLEPSGWRVYDVIGDGVSVVNNYRAQFDRFLSKKSFDELLQTLREKKSNLT